MREKLEAAWREYCPAPDPARVPFDASGKPWPGDGRGPYTDEFKAWSKSGTRFHRLIDAEAWLDAAMMLTPKDWHMDLRGVNSGWWCRINPTADGTTGEWDAYCSTSAEALLAAIEKARTA